MKRIFNQEAKDLINQEVVLAGWVNSRRDHGQIIFIDLRDRTGLMQLVFSPSEKEVYKLADTLRPEWVIEIKGIVNRRPKGMENNKLSTGQVEVLVNKIKILSQSKTLPFPIETDGYEISEDKRLKYRYLDMRRERIKNNLILRYQWQSYIRDFLKKKGFIEIETPILTKSTPEGARDFLVPSRLHLGKFYALPQSPQQYKQLLMIAGLERYFQFARCFRDEDIRADRGLEFTQIDIEMSFVSQEDILNLVEEMVIKVSEEVLNKKIQEKPFPRITYHEAMDKYKVDSPDLRQEPKDDNLLSYVWVVDFPMFEKKDDGSIGPCHHPFTAIHPDDIDLLNLKGEEIFKIRAQQYDLILNGCEVFGGSIRTTNPKILSKVFEILGYSKNEIKNRFGHLLKSFEYGVPPHGGIAGSDRWLQVMLNEPSIREVIPFPTTGSGITAVMEAPNEVDKEQLEELHIKIIK